LYYFFLKYTKPHSHLRVAVPQITFCRSYELLLVCALTCSHSDLLVESVIILFQVLQNYSYLLLINL
jgi:hypothetical protein